MILYVSVHLCPPSILILLCVLEKQFYIAGTSVLAVPKALAGFFMCGKYSFQYNKVRNFNFCLNKVKVCFHW